MIFFWSRASRWVFPLQFIILKCTYFLIDIRRKVPPPNSTTPQWTTTRYLHPPVSRNCYDVISLPSGRAANTLCSGLWSSLENFAPPTYICSLSDVTSPLLLQLSYFYSYVNDFSSSRNLRIEESNNQGPCLNDTGHIQFSKNWSPALRR